jgi:hypothetical protein
LAAPSVLEVDGDDGRQRHCNDEKGGDHTVAEVDGVREHGHTDQEGVAL